MGKKKKKKSKERARRRESFFKCSQIGNYSRAIKKFYLFLVPPPPPDKLICPTTKPSRGRYFYADHGLGPYIQGGLEFGKGYSLIRILHVPAAVER